MTPYLCSALVSKQDTTGHRARVLVARSEAEATGMFLKPFLTAGYSIESVALTAMDHDSMRDIAACLPSDNQS